MKKTILLIIFLIISSYSSLADGSVIASSMMMSTAAITASNNAAQQGYNNLRNNGCIPPIDFAIQHNCDLKIACSSCVNEYYCAWYNIKSDCDGNVYYVHEDKTNYTMLENMPIFSAIIMLVAIIIILWVVFSMLRGD